MLDLNSFNKALKLSWVTKYLNDDNSGKWKLLFNFQLRDHVAAEFFRGNVNRKNLIMTIIIIIIQYCAKVTQANFDEFLGF